MPAVTELHWLGLFFCQRMKMDANGLSTTTTHYHYAWQEDFLPRWPPVLYFPILPTKDPANERARNLIWIKFSGEEEQTPQTRQELRDRRPTVIGARHRSCSCLLFSCKGACKSNCTSMLAKFSPLWLSGTINSLAGLTLEASPYSAT